MFHFPTFPPLALYIQARVTGHDPSRVSPFGHPRIKVWLPTPRGFSQAPTSFIGFWCQGIHRAPLITWLQRFDARVHCAVLKVRAGRRFPGRLPTWWAVRLRFHGPDRRPKALVMRFGHPIPQDPTVCRPPRSLISCSTPRRGCTDEVSSRDGHNRCSTLERLGRTYACT